MSKQHKWFDVIVAWAGGATVQYRRLPGGAWEDIPFYEHSTPRFGVEYQEWRVKPSWAFNVGDLVQVVCSEGYPEHPIYKDAYFTGFSRYAVVRIVECVVCDNGVVGYLAIGMLSNGQPSVQQLAEIQVERLPF